MLKVLLAKKLAAVALSLAVTVIVPCLIQNKPIILWTWNKLGPVVVDRVQDRIDRRFPPHTEAPP